ncbi:hypothetical protein LJK87_13040 [Paenibacillus sp. P25]|nr:hypothetical protein LJK87_13040 [Paenibacillus sp. P25]
MSFKKRFTRLSVPLALVSALMFPALAQAAPPAPVLHNDNASAHFGDWYTGAAAQRIVKQACIAVRSRASLQLRALDRDGQLL